MVNVWDPWHTIFFRSTMGSCEIDAWRTWNRSGPAVERRLFLNAMRFLRSKQMKMCLRLMLIIIIIISSCRCTAVTVTSHFNGPPFINAEAVAHVWLCGARIGGYSASLSLAAVEFFKPHPCHSISFHFIPFGYGSIPIDTFLLGWTSINPSYFDVNYRGTRVLTHCHMNELMYGL